MIEDLSVDQLKDLLISHLRLRAEIAEKENESLKYKISRVTSDRDFMEKQCETYIYNEDREAGDPCDGSGEAWGGRI